MAASTRRKMSESRIHENAGTLYASRKIHALKNSRIELGRRHNQGGWRLLSGGSRGRAAPSQILRRPVEIERESNRRKLESFRAIKSDLIFNKFPPSAVSSPPSGGRSFPVRGGDRAKGVEGPSEGGRRVGERWWKGNLLGNYKVTSSGDAHSCEYSNAITSMIA